MTVSLVQKATTVEGSTASNLLALPSATTAGNTLIVCLNLYGKGGGTDIPDVVTVTDNAGSVFTRLTAAEVTRTGTNWGQHIVFFLATGIAAKASYVLSTTYVAATWNWIGIWETTPANLDVTTTVNNGLGAAAGTISVSPGTLTPTANGAFLLATAQFDGSSVIFTATDGTWTFNQNASAGGGSMYTASKPQATIAADTATFTTVGNNAHATQWSTIAVSFVTTTPQPITATATARASSTALVTVPQPMTATAAARSSSAAVVATTAPLIPTAQAASAAGAALTVPQRLQANATGLSRASCVVTYPGQIVLVYPKLHLLAGTSMTQTLVLRESSAYDLEIKASAARDETVSTH